MTHISESMIPYSTCWIGPDDWLYDTVSDPWVWFKTASGLYLRLYNLNTHKWNISGYVKEDYAGWVFPINGPCIPINDVIPITLTKYAIDGKDKPTYAPIQSYNKPGLYLSVASALYLVNCSKTARYIGLVTTDGLYMTGEPQALPVSHVTPVSVKLSLEIP